MHDGLSPADRERIVRLETKLKTLQDDVTELKRDVKDAIREWRMALDELRLALVTQKYTTKMDVSAPMDKLTGMRLALVGLGAIVVFAVTVLGGVLGAISFFRPH